MTKQGLGRPKTRVAVECPICDKVFEAKVSEIARGAGRYCGSVCRAEARRRGIPALAPENPRTPTIDRFCESCGRTFQVYPYRATAARPARFCSDKCRLTRPAFRVQPG